MAFSKFKEQKSRVSEMSEMDWKSDNNVSNWGLILFLKEFKVVL